MATSGPGFPAHPATNVTAHKYLTHRPLRMKGSVPLSTACRSA